MCHVYVRADNLAGVVISDDEYPHRVAHTLLTKVNQTFSLTNSLQTIFLLKINFKRNIFSCYVLIVSKLVDSLTFILYILQL